MSTKFCVEITNDGDGNGNGEPPVRSYVQTVGDGTTTSFTIQHNLNTSDLLYALRNTVTGEVDAFDVAITSPNVNSVVLTFATAPAAGSARIVLLAV